MKSSIKIDYAGLHKGFDHENKQPIIRIDLQKSDDPRDTLLNDLVRPSTVFGFSLKNINEDGSMYTYILYGKSRYHQVSDVAESTYNVLKFICLNEKFELICTHEEFYFSIKLEEGSERSKGLRRDELIFLDNDSIIKMLVQDFYSLIEKSETTSNINLC